MNHKFVATIKHKDHCFKQPTMRIEADPELPGRSIIVEILDPYCPRCSLHHVPRIDSMSESRFMDFHAAYAASASRMISERVLFSFFARASMT
ncbi:hypothetical protein ADIAG_01288 [Paeniglutamicibacter gangotriensis Lz1y]|uniref:Uncharacterized protein n=1 Tax=Paeniglutamicibacter gangotriensis Lz1y TaxID=1276920 RepID=M7MWI2_9MICC|nr:hypothetical protein ADIAG_01288 [Paeniglutamicibacter gangotriensis Lz1y]